MRDYDLTLIRAFLAVYETQSVTRAAKQLVVSQPAVSYSINRLRQAVGDELFVRRGNAMLPTRLAQSMYPRVKASLDALDEAITGGYDFDPRDAVQTFRLQLTDTGGAVLLPVMLSAMETMAPSVRLEVEPLSISRAPEQLLAGQIDAFVCAPRIQEPGIRRDILLEQHYLGVCSVEHPRLRAAPSLDEFLAEQHIAIADEVGHRQIDEALFELGVTRTIGLSIPSFFMLPGILHATELVGFVPLATIGLLRDSRGLRFFELPFAQPRSELSLYTRVPSVPSKANDWFRSFIMSSFAEVERTLEMQKTPNLAGSGSSAS